MHRAIFAAAVAATLSSAVPSGAQDLASGESIYRQACRQCHGPTGKGMGSFPTLLGHDAAYIGGKLEQYRSGERVGPNSALMAPVAAKLSDEEIANLTAFIVGLN